MTQDGPQNHGQNARVSADMRRFPAESGDGGASADCTTGAKVDLVLADFAMPEMTGAELAKTIQAKRPDLPVLIVTGFGGREALRDFGEAKILQKPYAENELFEKIASALR